MSPRGALSQPTTGSSSLFSYALNQARPKIICLQVQAEPILMDACIAIHPTTLFVF